MQDRLAVASAFRRSIAGLALEYGMSRGLRTVVVLGIALVAALAASYVAFIAMQRVSAGLGGPEFVPVVVAARDVPMGTLADARSRPADAVARVEPGGRRHSDDRGCGRSRHDSWRSP